MVIATKSKYEYSKLLKLGSENRSIFDYLCAGFLAICPILQYYIGPLEDAGITILILIMPWILARLSFRLARKQTGMIKIRVILGLLLFFIYRSLIHDINIKNILYNIVLLILYVSAIYGCINIRHYLYISSQVALLASVLVVVQTIFYYLFHKHIVLAPTFLFTQEADSWVMLAKTGLIGVTGRIGNLYRPSAFFMEPSHMFLYLFPQLFLTVLSPESNKFKIRRAFIYSLGMVLCTSGMGIVVTVGAWGLYYAMSNGKQNKLRLRNLFRPRNIIFVSVFLWGILFAFVSVSTFRESILRFLDFSDSGAIAGRTRLARSLLKTLEGKRLLFGVSNTTEGIGFNMAGYAATLYKFGIVGIILSYWTYVYGLIHLKQQYWWISFIVIAISFFSAQTHGTFYMMYYSFIILEGLYNVNRNKRSYVAT